MRNIWEGRIVKHINDNMRYAGKKTDICDHFCKKKPKQTEFFHWFSFFDNEYIKMMCMTCALREVWGYNYKSNKHYKKWVMR